MSEHLTSQQISEWMAGQGEAGWDLHLSACAKCAAEVEQLRQSLGFFRASVREVAQEASEVQTVFRTPNRGRRWLTGIVAASALLAILAWLPIYKARDDRQKAAETARQDAELLQQVDAELSAEVAPPMKPLEQMVSWGRGDRSQLEKRKF
jgi:recombinational DNA repair protein (RecF pathway)